MKIKFICLTVLLALSAATSAQAPDKLTALKQSYDRELQRLVDPITLKYVEALRKLQQVYVTENKLDEALAVRQEIEAVTSNTAAAKPETAGPANLPGAQPAAGIGQEHLWSGDGSKKAEGDNPILQVIGEPGETQKIIRAVKVEDFPNGMLLKFRYKTEDYAGPGLELRGYNSTTGHFNRTVTLEADNDWHSYEWPYRKDRFQGNKEIRFEIHLFPGRGVVWFDDLLVEGFKE